MPSAGHSLGRISLPRYSFGARVRLAHRSFGGGGRFGAQARRLGKVLTYRGLVCAEPSWAGIRTCPCHRHRSSAVCSVQRGRYPLRPSPDSTTAFSDWRFCNRDTQESSRRSRKSRTSLSSQRSDTRRSAYIYCSRALEAVTSSCVPAAQAKRRAIADRRRGPGGPAAVDLAR